MNDHQGSTWEEIVGAANVSDKRIGVGGRRDQGCKGGVVRGDGAHFDAALRQSASQLTVRKLTPISSTKASPVRCSARAAIAKCQRRMLDDDEGVSTLTGSWYFTPDHGDEWYVGTTAAGVTTYEAETLYAQFGHWLESDADTNVVSINTYALGGVDATDDSCQYDGARLDHRETLGIRHHTVGYVGQLPRACRRDVRPPDRQHGRHDQHDPIGCVYRHGQLGGDIRTCSDTWRHRHGLPGRRDRFELVGQTSGDGFRQRRERL